MKKQFMRYRLVVDQKVGRANKSEVLNDDLLQVEKHMEHVRVACLSTYKKMAHCLQTHGGGEYEKRLKRLNENTLAMAMSDASSTLLSDNEMYQGLGIAFDVCADAQSGLAKEKAMYEMFIDEHIISPLQTLVETDIPAIQKQREKLKRLVLDRDASQQNYTKAQKALNGPGPNPPQAAANVETLREKYDQAVTRMEQCKDQLVTEMFEFLSKENGHSQRIADFHAKQLDYHRRCVNLLEKLKPDFSKVQDKTVVNTSFGQSLKEHLKSTDREIASPLEACVLFLLAYGIKEEGIFRIAGGATKLKKVRSLVDGGVLDLSVYDAQDDVHAVAGAMKQYLRELPNPILTLELHDRWVKIANIKDPDEQAKEIQSVIDCLPPQNKANFRYLMKFCALVAEYQDINKMTPSNLAVVFGPNLLWSSIDDIGTRMAMSNLITNVVEIVISKADYFFPGEIDFLVTPGATSYQINLDHNTSGDAKSHHVTNQVPQQVPPKPVKPATHSRNSSEDVNLSDYSSSTISKKKNKSKAPPPPQTQAPPKIPVSSPPSNASTPSKPPVAAKRAASVRKPHLPPPPNPKDAPGGHERTMSAGDSSIPVPRPRPQARKTPSHSNPLINPPPGSKTENHCTNTMDDDNETYSPPMPSGPPPPLPPDLEEDLGTALTSELRF